MPRTLNTVLVALIFLTACSGSDDIVDPVPPVPVPTDLGVADLGADYMVLSWTAEMLPVVIESRLAGATSYVPVAELPAGAGNHEVTAIPDSTYFFRLAASDGDRQSNWTESLIVTARPAGYWEVIGGIKRQHDDARDVFFEFTVANRFDGLGQIVVTGPSGWNEGTPLVKDLTAMVVEFDGEGAVSGEYALQFTMDSGREFAALVTLDADVVLPPVTLDVVSGSETEASVVSWVCAGADRARFCFGWDQEPYVCAPVAVPADTTMWLPLPNRLGITAYRSAVDPGSLDPVERQAARSEWWGYDVTASPLGGQCPVIK